MPTAAAAVPALLAATAPLAYKGAVLLLAGMVALFACSRALATIFSRDRRPADAIGGRAVAYFLPIAAASVIAMLLGRPEIAVGIVFGTSVGALTTVVGFIAIAAPVGAGPARWRRLWPFQLFAALLVFVAGFAGTFKWREAIALLTEGLLLLTLWNDRADPAAEEATTTDAVLEDAVGHVPAEHVLNYASPGTFRQQWQWPLRVLELLLTAALLWLGGCMVTEGAVHSVTRRLSTSALAGSVISLALVLPMTYGARRASAGGRGWATVTTQIGVVLLNLCALLPILVLIPYLAVHIPQIAHFAGGALTEGNGVPRLLLFPVPMWRIDNVMLIVAGVFLLPVGLGKWSIGREEGMILIAAYFFYLTATITSGFDFRR